MSTTTVASAIGPQTSFTRAVWWVHVLFAVAFSIKAIAGVLINVSGLSIIGALAGIIISDITIYLLITSWQGRELVGAQRSWSFALYGLAMMDVFIGAIAGNVAWANAMYYSWGLWALLCCIFVCYVVIAVVVSPAAQADEEEKMSNLRAAQADHKSIIAERRNRSDAKLLKAHEAAAVRQARWSTMETFYGMLQSKPLRWNNRRQLNKKAGRSFQTLLAEVDAIDISRQLPASTPAREVVLEPSGDGLASRPPSFR